MESSRVVHKEVSPFMLGEPANCESLSFSGLLRSFTRVISVRPVLSLLVLLTVCCASVVYTARHLEFKNDRADLIDPNTDFQKRWLNYTQNFGEASDIVVVVEADSPHAIQEVLEVLGQRLRNDPDHFRCRSPTRRNRLAS